MLESNAIRALGNGNLNKMRLLGQQEGGREKQPESEESWIYEEEGDTQSQRA